jgi:hypothetical protein
MDFERLLRVVFVLYCTTVGVVLVLIPWTTGWELMLSHLHFPGVGVLKLPAARGAVTGFGLVHLVWGLHDLQELLHADGPPSHGGTRSQTARDQ